MQVIILAAGRGLRLKELTKEDTKCMIEIAGEKLIDRMIRQFLMHNINKIILVTGHGAEKS